MRRSIAVLENSFSVVPGVTTMALLASRTHMGSAFLCGLGCLPLSGWPGVESGPLSVVSGPLFGAAIGEPAALATGTGGNSGALLAKPAKGLEAGAESKNDPWLPLEPPEEEPEPPAELPAPSPLA